MKINLKNTPSAIVFERRLQSNGTSHIVYSRGDRFQLFHSTGDRVGIFQAVSCDGANYPTRLGNFLE